MRLCCRSRGERQGGQGDVVYPIGYSEKPVPDTSIQETDKNLVEKVSSRERPFNISFLIPNIIGNKYMDVSFLRSAVGTWRSGP